MLGRLTGVQAKVRYEEVQAGDPPHTYADTIRAQNELGFKPQVPLEDGLGSMVEWLRG
jgi:UDP-glucuronate 4-epimerase